jgi:PIN domain nuclease of toxin-antitoxin system
MLDTHVLVRWLADPKKLSRHQTRVLDEAVRRGEQVALSAVTLLELAILLTGDSPRIHANPIELFSELTSNPAFLILPLTVEVAIEVVLLGHLLRDPADRAIVATARVHRLGLLTSDQRIIESKMVSVIE